MEVREGRPDSSLDRPLWQPEQYGHPAIGVATVEGQHDHLTLRLRQAVKRTSNLLRCDFKHHRMVDWWGAGHRHSSDFCLARRSCVSRPYEVDTFATALRKQETPQRSSPWIEFRRCLPKADEDGLHHVLGEMRVTERVNGAAQNCRAMKVDHLTQSAIPLLNDPSDEIEINRVRVPN